jgi:hypothetical protein
MRLTLKKLNDELAKRGHTARLAKAASGYFYFESGEAVDWLDRTVNVPTVNSLTLAQWVAEFDRLKKVNAEIMGTKGGKPAPKRKQTKVNR